MYRCSLGCSTLIEEGDGHDRCVRCLGVQHTEAAFVDTSCPHCVIQKVAVTGDCLPTGTSHHFVCYTGCDIGGYGPKVRDIGATASKSACISRVSDMGNSANVNPPAKCSRADRTPFRSSERSLTGGGIPSGSSATHSETMCDVDEMSLAASEGDWHPTLTNPSSTPSGRVQDEAEVMSSVLTRGYVVPEVGLRCKPRPPQPHFFTPRLGRIQASEISRDVCFPATQDPFDFGSGSCAPTGGTPEAEIEGETSTPSATFSREGTLTGRPQGEQHRARTFTATALIGRYGTAPASSPKPDPFQGLAPTYSQSFLVLPGCTCSRSHTPLDCARQTRPHALARRRNVHTRQLLPLSNRQCVQLSR
ncbi:hypothetical protein E1301_Tti018840 [Triplophysa tibetana]|uniref:Uncharacterized protein n=1 Tax=Triplophysa tibetana TaxID=1572043 RepID=A0A5A9PCM9_9TELE|nr:hypothetical protein E1301_Tti018840 [Triplophysa tibetana]